MTGCYLAYVQLLWAHSNVKSKTQAVVLQVLYFCASPYIVTKITKENEWIGNTVVIIPVSL